MECMAVRRYPILLAFCLTACVVRPAPVEVAQAPSPAPVPTPVPMPLPPGASPGMNVPFPLVDGSFPTPNRNLSPAGALWHLRGGLNVAALACRGPGEAATIARYNALLASRKSALAAAQKAYEAEYRGAAGAEWQARWDSAMTRLYNHFSQTPPREGFCAASEALLVELETVPAEELPAFARARLADLDRPFTGFYAAYHAWRTQSPPVALAHAPRIEVDPKVLRQP